MQKQAELWPESVQETAMRKHAETGRIVAGKCTGNCDAEACGTEVRMHTASDENDIFVILDN